MSDQSTVIPMIAHEDGPAAMAWPSRAFGFRERRRETCLDARKWSEMANFVDGVHVYVDDVEAHRQRAEEAGAAILSPVEEGAVGKRYRAEDLEGHRWMFTER